MLTLILQVPAVPPGMEKAIAESAAFGIPPFLVWAVVILFLAMGAAIVGLFRALRQESQRTITLLVATQKQVEEQIKVVAAIPEMIARHATESSDARRAHESRMTELVREIREAIQKR